MALLEALAGLLLTPGDWTQLARACLSPGQYLDWKSWNEEFCVEQAAANRENNQREWNRDMLLGRGTFEEDQTQYPRQVYEQISRCGLQAWRRLAGKGEHTGHLTKIIQGQGEPFSDFVARMLEARFNITRAQAQDIVRHCPACVISSPQQSIGVNPRGLRPNHIWQMDVTHIPEFGKLKYVHVSVDTAFQVMFASAEPGERATHAINHCLAAWAAWGKPNILKTDNGPAYTSKIFMTFCQQMEVTLKRGIPYNPQGQGIIERSHRTLKGVLQKQKEGIGHGLTPKGRISLALFTIIIPLPWNIAIRPQPTKGWLDGKMSLQDNGWARIQWLAGPEVRFVSSHRNQAANRCGSRKD
ncbi:igE-binding protein isoform X1 [Cavia porcellus]|uniref:igE-binding protein isoform X1 n=1 Tax=Cavia porcellus TaxID=10141 RepID=UPI002FE3A791